MSAEATSTRTEIPAELLEVFSLEAHDHMQAIGAAVGHICAGDNTPEHLRALRRSVHTLKGAAGMVGFRTVSQLAHRMEDLLDNVQERGVDASSEITDLLRRSADLLSDLVEGRSDGDIPSRLADVYAAYEALAFPAGEAPAPAGGSLSLASDPGEPGDAAASLLEPAMPGGARERVLRVPRARVDDAVREVGELVVTSSNLDQNLDRLRTQVNEMELSVQRLSRIATRLETEYEVLTLGGNLERRFGKGGATWAGAAGEPGAFDELEMDRYTDFHLISRDLAETSSDLGAIRRHLGELSNEFAGSLTRVGQSTTALQDTLMSLRLVPLTTIAARLERTVRVTAEQKGKEVEVLLDGLDQPLDATVVDVVAEALLHLLRNAVDHGIEPPDVRRAVGKSATGHVIVSASRRGSQIAIEVSDDGSGLDYGKLLARGLEAGLLTEDEVDTVSEARLRSLMFLPGFSTSSEVDEISGRGVGLDVVQDSVRALKGHVAIESVTGEGTTFSLRLPMSLTIVRGVVVESGSGAFAMPLESISAVHRLKRADVNDGSVRLGTRQLPARFLQDALGLAAPKGEGQPDDRLVALVVDVDGKATAMIADDIVETRDLVVKPLGAHLRFVPGLAGATLLGDGRVVLIIEPREIAGERVHARRVVPLLTPAAGVEFADRPLEVMIVDDSISVRRVLAMLVTNMGWNAVQARDGLDALEQCWRMTTPPDIILLDVEMPRLDGFELTSALRAQDTFCNVPIVMITSRSGDKHRQRAMSVGVNEYLVKPFDEDVLLRTIRRLTGRSAGAAA